MRSTKLGEVCHITDGAHSKVDRQTEGLLYLTSKNIKRGNLDLNNVDYISNEDFDRLFPINSKAGRRPIEGDVLIGIIGTFGNAYVYRENDNFGISSSIGLIRPNKSEVDSSFLYYVIVGKRFSALIDSYKSGSVQGYTNIPTLKQIPINLPPLPEQKAIAKILGDLDDKIELNRKMKQTFEEMAQALFKSWFVDFDPVLDNAIAAGNEIPDELHVLAKKRRLVAEDKKLLNVNPELAELFPNRFVFNEALGKWIPEGWENTTVGEHFFVKGGYAFKSKDFISEGVPVIKIKNIKSDKTIDNNDLSYVHIDIASQRQEFWLNDGDLLMAMTGATVGKFGIVVKKNDELMVLNQRVAKFHSNFDELESIWFVYCFFNDNRNFDLIVNSAQGSAQPNISANDIMRTPMITGGLNILKKFEELVSKNFEKTIQNQKQTETLTKLRDTLLPQLISGKLRVPEALLKLEIHEE